MSTSSEELWWSWWWDTEEDGDQNDFKSIHGDQIFTRGRWNFSTGTDQRNLIFLQWSVSGGISNTCQKLNFYNGDLRSITLEAKFDSEVPKKNHPGAIPYVYSLSVIVH